MVLLQRPVPECSYVTPDETEGIVCAQLSAHATVHVPATPCGCGLTYPRPEAGPKIEARGVEFVRSSVERIRDRFLDLTLTLPQG